MTYDGDPWSSGWYNTRIMIDLDIMHPWIYENDVGLDLWCFAQWFYVWYVSRGLGLLTLMNLCQVWMVAGIALAPPFNVTYGWFQWWSLRALGMLTFKCLDCGLHGHSWILMLRLKLQACLLQRYCVDSLFSVLERLIVKRIVILANELGA